ncbi:MAG: beta-galactosidase [Acidobacteria bacterium]|nr:beta-galactosidase [Acidobacteriota bacterium]
MNRAAVRLSLAVLVAFAAACGPEPATSWKPAGDRIATRWAAEVGPESVLPEYPRPQLVRPEWAGLNGLWDYAITARDAGRPAAWDGKILVPFAVESSLSGVGKPVGIGNALWYRRTVDVPKAWRSGRVLLHFGAVDWECTVWVNGREAGTHRGGYDPFTYDVTGLLKRGGGQEIVLRVWDPTDEDNRGIARGKQVMKPHGIFYTAVTGVWQTVWMEPVPETYIARLDVTSDIRAGTLTFRPRIVGDPAGLSLAVTVERNGTAAGSARGPAAVAAVVGLDRPALWSPDDPALYDVKVSLAREGREIDAVTSYAGLREISVAKDRHGFNRLFLNGEPLFQFGPLDQGWWPDGLYTAPTDAALRYDLETIKGLGLNMLRKHVKVEPDRLYSWCDRLGLLVWQDMPSALYEREAMAADDLAVRDAQFEGEWKAVMDALRNHPSIVMWVPFNEGWGQYDTERIAAWTKSYDPTRLVNNASGWTDKGAGDTVDIHSYPGPDMPKPEERRAAVLGEFGGLGLPLTGHLWQAEGNWGYRNFDDTAAFEARYTELIKNLYPLVDRGLAAAVYTQTSDCEVEVNGLLTYDRAVLKLDPARFSPLNRGFLPPRFLTDQSLFVGPYLVVELSARPGATIRYTLDGADPDPASALYEKPIEIVRETTVKARAFWPDGTASLAEIRTFRRAEPLPAVSAPGAKGLAWESFEGTFDKLPDFGTLTAARTGTTARPDASLAGLETRFAMRFRGFVRVPREGVYIFYISSDDGSKLTLAGRELVAIDGVHGMTEEGAEIALGAGWHPFELVYFQSTGDMGLDLAWSGPGIKKGPVPASAFGH